MFSPDLISEKLISNTLTHTAMSEFTKTFLLASNIKNVISKSRMQEALNLLQCAYSSTDTKTSKIEREKNVNCHLSPVACHLYSTLLEVLEMKKSQKI